MLRRIILITTLVSIGLLFILLNVATPSTTGPLGILVVFILTYVAFLGLITYFLYGVTRIFAHLSSFFTAKKPLKGISFKRSYYYATIVATAPVMLIGLQSIGAVGIQEFLLVGLFVVIGCLYIERVTR